MMDGMEIYKVVRKLVGPIYPVGVTERDDIYFENLKVMTDLVDKLITDICDVETVKAKPEFSRKRAGEFAAKFLDKIGIVNE